MAKEINGRVMESVEEPRKRGLYLDGRPSRWGSELFTQPDGERISTGLLARKVLQVRSMQF